MPDSSVAPRERRLRPANAVVGQLDIRFGQDADGVTQLAAQYASYPFHLCRPFRLPGDPQGMATLYTQSCSGGIYEGDRLGLRIAWEDGAKAHVTTQAASIAYGMRELGAEQHAALSIGPSVIAEYLPDPTILFPRARLDASLRIAWEASARVLAAEAFLLHDPQGAGRPFARLASLIEVVHRPAGELLFRERLDIPGEAWTARRPGVTGAAQGMATLVVLDHDPAALPGHLREALAPIAGLWGGASLLPNGIGAVCRMLAEDGRALKAGMAAAWRAVRLRWTGAAPIPRRK